MGSDLISRQAAIDAFDKEIWSNIDIPICKEIRTAVKKTIEQLPSAQPERKTGRWEHGEDTGEKMYECSECECRMIARWYDLAVGTNGKRYCPYCGAKMDGSIDDKVADLPMEAYYNKNWKSGVKMEVDHD